MSHEEKTPYEKAAAQDDLRFQQDLPAWFKTLPNDFNFGPVKVRKNKETKELSVSTAEFTKADALDLIHDLSTAFTKDELVTMTKHEIENAMNFPIIIPTPVWNLVKIELGLVTPPPALVPQDKAKDVVEIV